MSKECKNVRQRIDPKKISEDLDGYELVKDYFTLRRYDRVKYIRKDSGKYVKGGIIVLRDYKTCKPFHYSVTLSDVILFRKKD